MLHGIVGKGIAKAMLMSTGKQIVKTPKRTSTILDPKPISQEQAIENLKKHLGRLNAERRALNNKFAEFDFGNGIVVVALNSKTAISRFKWLLREYNLTIEI